MWSSFSRRIWGNQESDAYERGDAVLAWWDPELQFEFVMIFDTHHKTKNIDYIIEAISERKEKLKELFSYPIHLAFHHTHMYLLALFTDELFIKKCDQDDEELACLICLRKGEFYIGYQLVIVSRIYSILRKRKMEKDD